MRSKKDIKMRLSYDFLEPTDEMPKYYPVPEEIGKKFKAEVEARRLARQNMPRFRVKDNLFSDSSDGGVRGYIKSRIRAKYSSCRIPSTARIILFLDEIEKWEKEHLEQGLGDKF
ncbi:hypothetical protein VN0264_04060 [Helicobacter pylori]|nr:hypothetical protein VN0264_04060 [Helicobacter pylori]